MSSLTSACHALGAAKHFRYGPTADFKISDTGHAISVDLMGSGCGGPVFSSNVFNIVSVNFHVGSEHTFIGEGLPLEFHLAHKQ